MVLFKRKPVQYLSRPQIHDDNTEVWILEATGEVFLSYESYLHRLDFYKKRRFICEITGHSGLSFFEALQSERDGSKDVDAAFPDPLKEPLLRKVQFSTISRIDFLVDHLYDEFKQDFYPGETVTVIIDNGERLSGVVREKARFPELLNAAGEVERKAFSRYFVALTNRPDEEALVDDEHLSRDRKVFTKQMLRSFIKNTATRESWNGAPWLVKDKAAQMYKIDTDVPLHLRYGHKRAEKKALQAQRYSDVNGEKTGKRAYRNSLGKIETTTSPPPTTRYPIEDLEVKPSRDGTHRPAIKSMRWEWEVETPFRPATELRRENLLIETWETLNVYCEVFQLDSFTFDDFVEAVQVYSTDVHCDLLVECHCALLKVLVDGEAQGGKVQVTLPEIDEEESDDEDDEEEEEEEKDQVESSPDPEPPRKGRVTRSSLTKTEIDRKSRESSSESKEAKSHMAAEMLEDYGWIDRLRKRDFKNGGWQTIIVGLLHQLERDERYSSTCEGILKELAPVDEEPTQETAKTQYDSLPTDQRILILHFLCMLTIDTKAVRGYMEECTEQMTVIRKERVEWQRHRKAALEELRALDEQRKIMLPDNMPPSPEPEPEPMTNGHAKNGSTDVEEDADEVEDSDDSDDQNPRSLRRGIDRAAQRKRKRDEQRERKEKAEAVAKANAPKFSTQFKKVLRDMEKKRDEIKEYEDEVAIRDNDLREADCYRIRCLGKDRFWNRYWWFEINGMPYGGLPTSSTAESGYANGCLWVRGPEEDELKAFISSPGSELQKFEKMFQMTMESRKRTEEGGHCLWSSTDWAYYDEPDSVDMLIGWLDSRGEREMRLRKELQQHRDKICQCMSKRLEYLKEVREEKERKRKADLESSAAGSQPTRVSARTKTQQPEPMINFHCLGWKNTTALRELGHLHSDPPRQRRGIAKKVDTTAASAATTRPRERRAKATPALETGPRRPGRPPRRTS